MVLGSLGLAFLAGLLTILSPCVLPILPIVLGAAAAEKRTGPIALAIGLSASFVSVGLFAATIGFSIGLDSDWFRYVAALLIVGIGVVLTLPHIDARLAIAGGPMASWADQRCNDLRASGLSCQFMTGFLLGALWSPCVGPTLGAASLLAAQRHDLGEVGAVMFVFGLGAVVPLLALGLLSRELLWRWRNRLASAGRSMRTGLGLAFVVIGLLVLTGLDRSVEAALVDASPQWLTNLTTRY
jgi:cytochrome c-type biogenesis protein